MSASHEVELGNLIELGNSVENTENESTRGVSRNYAKHVRNVASETALKRDWKMTSKWHRKNENEHSKT